MRHPLYEKNVCIQTHKTWQHCNGVIEKITITVYFVKKKKREEDKQVNN